MAASPLQPRQETPPALESSLVRRGVHLAFVHPPFSLALDAHQKRFISGLRWGHWGETGHAPFVMVHLVLSIHNA